MSALPIGGEGRDTPRRGVPAENEAVRGGGASGVKEETEPMTKRLDEENGVWSLQKERVSFCFSGVEAECSRSVRGKVGKLMGFGFGCSRGRGQLPEEF